MAKHGWVSLIKGDALEKSAMGGWPEFKVPLNLDQIVITF